MSSNRSLELLPSCSQRLVVVVLVTPDPHVAVHVVKEEMKRESADDQVETRLRKMNDLDAVKRKQAGIWSRIDAVLGHVDQKLLADEGAAVNGLTFWNVGNVGGGGITPGSMAVRIS